MATTAGDVPFDRCDYRALYAVWEVYGGEDEEEQAPPRPSSRRQGKKVVEELRALLATE